MQIDSSTGAGSIGAYSAIKPQRPPEPQAPPGGNVENRQPPPEPQPPQASTAGTGRGQVVDISV